MFTAYWIAFGPHGPRTLPPPGEGMKVFTYTMIGVAASGVIFGTVRYFGRGTPRTMTKEYQEATNEYLKVRITPSARHLRSDVRMDGIITPAQPILVIVRASLTTFRNHRNKRSSPSPVSAAKATPAPVRCRARPEATEYRDFQREMLFTAPCERLCAYDLLLHTVGVFLVLNCKPGR